ncbi:ead/Ea22-like family protein [Cronobacter dublinensis]
MNTAKLKAAAEKATPGKWWIDSHGSAMVSFTGNGMKTIFVTDGKAMGKAVRHQDTGNLSHWRNDNDATFIATANPSTVLELIAALEAAEKHNAELEQVLSAAQNDEIDARCHVDELERRVAELEARKITVRFDAIPMSELGSGSDGKGHPYLFGAGYNSATVRCKSELQLACAAAGINLETGGEA